MRKKKTEVAKQKKKPGPVSMYTEALAEAICERMEKGRTLLSICREDGMPSLSTIYRWLDDFPEFGEAFARASKIGAHSLVEEGLDILDSSDPEHASLANYRAGYRRWLAGKRNSAYGDKSGLEITGKDGGPVAVEQPALTPEQFAILQEQNARITETMRKKLEE